MLVTKLATPISNGGLHFTPPGIITGSARGGISQYHYFWLPSYVGLATFFRPLVYHSLLVPECICVLSLHSHFPLLKRNILLPKNVYPHTYFDTLGACQTTSVYFYLLGMTCVLSETRTPCFIRLQKFPKSHFHLYFLPSFCNIFAFK